ncbi:RNA polymerase sigma factor [Streptomyces chartreusis]|uniref:RNA polymerase sigma factor n=1 Tax=Streptomyces chartreusis TaxID=1969 RepID=UPI0036BA16D4
MSGSDKKNRRIPRQTGTVGQAVHPVEALRPEAQRQWDLMIKLRPAVRNIAYRCTGLPATALDDIESRVWLALYVRLKNSGPLNSKFGRVESYLWSVVRSQAQTYMVELSKRAEDFVGDDTYLLDTEENAHPGPEHQILADLVPAMKVLREEFSDLQLRVFVLAEGYGLKAPLIADLVKTSKGTVRDALRIARAKLRSERVGLRLGVFAEVED